MPRLWNETIEAHRRAVHDAVLDAAAALVAEHGLRSVTVSRVAERAGIGRATLYKYFSDAEAILLAWHERQVSAHFDRLLEARDLASGPADRLVAVLEAYALTAYEARGHHDAELAAVMHRSEGTAAARGELHRLLRALLAEAAHVGAVRSDITPDELAGFCLHALAAAADLPAEAAVRRLIALTMDALRPS